MLIPPILNIAEIAHQHLANTFILSPGSRNAHISIGLVRHPSIQTYTIPDERAGAFVSMGMAQNALNRHLNTEGKLELVGIVCTSGSASYNYAPAIAEAYFQKIPLLVITADRPPEWIDQLDGQTIRQREIYGKHVAQSFEFPVDFSHQDAVWHSERMMNEAINLAKKEHLPVHINIPIREPFYPIANEKVSYNRQVQVFKEVPSEKILSKAQWNKLLDVWDSFDKKMIVAGQNPLQEDLCKSLENLEQDYQIPVVADSISNLHTIKNVIRHQDTFLLNQEESFREYLRPDLLITFGKSLISKSLKLFLRKYKPKKHWHIQARGVVADTFQSVTDIIPVEPGYFFRQLFSDLDFLNMLEGESEEENPFYEFWHNAEENAKRYLYSFQFPTAQLSEMQAIQEVLENMKDCNLHLANSMTVRYVNFLGIRPEQNIEVFANRGTSGIDGSTSTAVGVALANPDKENILITGDLAFFYDRNALWHNYIPQNLSIILLNNHAGGIFRMINGAKDQPELAEYFETSQKLNAENTAKDFGLQYFQTNHLKGLKTILPLIFAQKRAKILEIETDSQFNAKVFEEYKLFSKNISNTKKQDF